MRNSIKLPAIGAVVAGMALFGGALSASATHVAPTLLSGNFPCSGVLFEPVADGSKGGVNVDVTNGAFDFTTDAGVVVTDVLVKGGPNTNWYHYDPASTGDTGLTAPINPKNERPYGLSHLCFTVDDEKTPDPDPK